MRKNEFIGEFTFARWMGVIINFRDKNGVIARFRDKNVVIVRFCAIDSFSVLSIAFLFYKYGKYI